MIFEIIKIIAKKGLYNELEISTIELSKKLNKSQQSISRILIDMENQDLIQRKISNKGIKLNLTEKSIKLLKKECEELNEILKPKNKLKGKIINGIGQGSYYVKIYSKKIKEITNFKPFFGTLNLEIDLNEFEKFIINLKPHLIEKFNANNRTYGDLLIYNVKINNIESAILIPKRTLHPKKIIEIIGPYNFKKRFNLKQDDFIEIEKW